MAKAADLLERLLAGQCKNWRYPELAQVLRSVGYQEVSRSGSHRTWKHPEDPKLLTVPGGGPLQQGYIRLAARRIRGLRGEG
jgi:predicted RNA binding protein YcfA (HicA-like mRNA interferase family)